VADAVRDKQENTLFLSGVRLPATLKVTTVLGDALEQADLIVFAVPSHVARTVLSQMASIVSLETPLVSATKGIEERSLLLMTDLIRETLSRRAETLAVLSGPSFALEVCRGYPTAVVLAGADRALIRRLQALFMTPRFRVYGSADMTGVQLGGALKNVIALAAGVVDGLGLGYNTRAALMTRGLAEMIRLGAAMGADPQTFYGLSGVGDLVLTCTGPLSRNHAVGVRLGKGDRLADIQRDTKTVAEGIRTSRAALELAVRHRVDMPIVREVCAVLFDGKPPRQAVADLMERAAKEETGY
jgi:glycerol-3-phosphate dehydrogenase (NAD(P)+)